MSNYKVELERTEKQDLEIKKHISDVKAIVKSKVNKDVNGLNSIKNLLENETLGGYIVDDKIQASNVELINSVRLPFEYAKVWDLETNITNFEPTAAICYDKIFIPYNGNLDVYNKYYGKKVATITGNKISFILQQSTVDDTFIVIADNVLTKISADGKVIWKNTTVSGLTGLYIFDNYIYTTAYSVIHKFSLNGDYITASENFGYVGSIVDSGDNIVLFESGNTQLRFISKKTLKKSFEIKINSTAIDITSNDEGSVYILRKRHGISKYDKNGNELGDISTGTNSLNSRIYTVGKSDIVVHYETSSGKSTVKKYINNEKKSNEIPIDMYYYKPILTNNHGDVLMHENFKSLKLFKNYHMPIEYKVLKVERGL